MTQDIINQGVMRREIRKIVKDELKKLQPQKQINSIWSWINKFHDRLKCLETKI